MPILLPIGSKPNMLLLLLLLLLHDETRLLRYVASLAGQCLQLQEFGLAVGSFNYTFCITSSTGIWDIAETPVPHRNGALHEPKSVEGAVKEGNDEWMAHFANQTHSCLMHMTGNGM
ncbi:hypothetical protein BGZ63DRAFT_400130 [Mariannaea sp. PMI_226]|nr:hypothetical protein BGZ63DRAFT_400130 [Mariannaea sp. PMI_226]